MAQSENKTKPTRLSPKKFIAAIEPAGRREDGLILLDLFNRVTGLKPVMWGASIIGYGRYAYHYKSGRSGEFMLTGFSSRKSALTLYVMAGSSGNAAKLKRLGKHKLGKSCLYINKLDDVDQGVLEEMIRDDVAYMRANYETWDA